MFIQIYEHVCTLYNVLTHFASFFFVHKKNVYIFKINNNRFSSQTKQLHLLKALSIVMKSIKAYKLIPNTTNKTTDYVVV